MSKVVLDTGGELRNRVRVRVGVIGRIRFGGED